MVCGARLLILPGGIIGIEGVYDGEVPNGGKRDPFLGHALPLSIPFTQDIILLYSEKVPCQLRIFFGYNECRRVPIYYFDFPLPATTSEESQKNLADKTRPFFKRLFVFLFQTPLR